MWDEVCQENDMWFPLIVSDCDSVESSQDAVYFPLIVTVQLATLVADEDEDAKQICRRHPMSYHMLQRCSVFSR